MKRLVLASSLLLLLAMGVFAEVPNEITYSGRLREFGKPVNGKRTVNFRIYDANGPVWQTGNFSIQVTSGAFSCILTPTINWEKKDYWIETVVNGKELSPREKVSAHPFALRSQVAEDIEKPSGTIHFSISGSTSVIISNTGIRSIVSGEEFYMVPRGSIIMWSGAINMIPSGWVLCDGTNGTPDLRDRFIVGAGRNYHVSDTGGTDSVVLSKDMMPAHDHLIGQHVHKINKHSHDAKHHHNIPSSSDTAGGGKAAEGNLSQEVGIETSDDDVITSEVELMTNTPEPGGRTDSTGGNQAHENRPPYYAISFIMKL
jgi:microcystin-dependent protein